MKGFILLSFLLIGSLSLVNGQELPLDFESTSLTYDFVDFDGGQAVVIPNAQASGINTSANVVQMVKSAGQHWGGSTIELANPIDFSADRLFKVKVYSPRVGARLLLKVENLTNGGIFFEREDTITVANAWEELSFDFSQINAANQYSKVVLIFDIGLMGDGSTNFTFLFDDIELLNGGPILAPVNLPVTFEDTTVNYDLVDFGGNYSSIVPDPTAPNHTVAMSTKSIGAELWAGTTMGQYGYTNRIPISATETKMNVRVYSPAIGLVIRLKIEEENDPTKSVETEALTTLANSWETLEFDFANEANGTAALNPAYIFNQASIFFNFGKTGSEAGADTTFYWDDVMFGPSTVGIEDLFELGLLYYPNPVQNSLNVEAASNIESIYLFNTMGQLLMQKSVNQTKVELKLNKLTPGVYLIRAKVGNQLGSFRVIKE
ncbi:MAG: T9SS type A sorting domain-containing protein [Bacteroidia bacterium]